MSICWRFTTRRRLLFLAHSNVIRHGIDIEIFVGHDVSVRVEQTERSIAQQTVVRRWIRVSEAEHRAFELLLAVAHLFALFDVLHVHGGAHDSLVKTETFAGFN